MVPVRLLPVIDGMRAGPGVLAGQVLGTLVALALTRLVRGLLFGVSATDPTVYLLASACLGLVVLAACYVPGWRASRVNPAEILAAD